MIKKVSIENRILVINIIGTFVLKGISILISFFSTPGYLKFFENAEVLGVWFTILSILNWIMMFDLGIGNGLRNKLAKYIVKDDKKKCKTLVSSAYILLGLVSILMLIIGEITVFSLDWNWILNINNQLISSKVLTYSVAIIYFGIVFQFWIKLITSILLSMRKNILSSILLIITNALIIAFLYFPFNEISLEDRLLYLSFFYIFAINIPLIITTIILFSKNLRYALPSIHFYDQLEARDILNVGGLFFIIQILLLIINSTNEWLISFLYTTADVVDYQIYYRVFNLILVFFSLITQPIWSSVTIEFEKNNLRWVRRIYIKLLLLVTCCIPLLIVSGILFRPFIVLWLGEDVVDINSVIVFLFCLSTFEMILINATTCIANGIGKLKCQFNCFLLAAIIKFPLTFLLSNYIESWNCIILVNIISLIPICIMQPLILNRQLKMKYN